MLQLDGSPGRPTNRSAVSKDQRCDTEEQGRSWWRPFPEWSGFGSTTRRAPDPAEVGRAPFGMRQVSPMAPVAARTLWACVELTDGDFDVPCLPTFTGFGRRVRSKGRGTSMTVATAASLDPWVCAMT